MAAHTPSSRSRPFTAAIHELAGRADAAVLLDLEGTILFANEAWDRFARTGAGFGEAVVGAKLLDGVPGDLLRSVLRQLLERAAHKGGGPPATMTSECNTPDVARLVITHVAPVLAGNEPIGLTLVQRVVRELPVAEVYPVVDGNAEGYRAGDGVLEQCSCCRRTRRPADPAEWDFVPALVAAPPDDTVFGYCPFCHELHNPLGTGGGR
ncbi:MAG TPA: hypothetical protein VFG59_02885 [Anaeromyxobacter sp.]|nr:hypothetical protein [Anaeromyxobacter sp.]